MRAWRLVVAALLWLVLWAPGVAHAVNVTVEHGLSANVIEVGEPVTVSLVVSLDEDVEPQRPELVVPPGFKSSRVNTQSMKLNFNGTFRRDFSARWVVIPDRAGTFELAAPSVTIEGTKVSAKSKLSVEVVKKGRGPSGRRQPGMQAFFAPALPFDLDDPFFEFKPPAKTFTSPRDLVLPRELDDSAFLYMHADKSQAVVGEQVTVSTWLYYRIVFESLQDRTEPAFAAFTRQVTSVPEEMRQSVETRVAGRGYYARQLGEVAIFPIRAGELHTGSFAAKLEVIRAGRRTLLPRESNDVVIAVSEAPAAGRPLGYKAGTVGRFKMKADVAPKETTAGDTVSVTVEVTGVGSLPSELRLPSRVGIEWLKPERKEGLSMVHGYVGGWRTFEYAVRFTEPGDIDLGNLELPYWDPDKKKYEVATAELGTVKVAARQQDDAGVAPTPLAGAVDEADPLQGMEGPRTTLQAFEAPRDEGLAPTTLWTWVLVPPLGVGLWSAGLATWRRTRRRRAAKENDPEVLARRALAEMKASHDAQDAARLAENAVHLAIEAALGLKSRGLMRAELIETLAADLPDGLADDVSELLELCSTLRFEPTSGEEAGKVLHKKAELTVKALLSA